MQNTKFIELRGKYPEFIYESFNITKKENDIEIAFKFVCGEVEFNPTTTIKNIDFTNLEELNNVVFNLGMVEMISYWKAFCSPKITIKAGYLDKYQKEWWKKLFVKGLSQFYYENKIDFRDPDLINFVNTRAESKINPIKVNGENFALIPIGGGKDSTVTLELIKNNFDNVSGFLLNPTKAQKETAEVAGVDFIEVDREIDNKLLDLNKEGFLNGHTPFSAMLAFTSILVGVITDYKYVVFSNEQSSNEGNVKYLETEVNHQYSKSLEFENDFREYNQKYLSNINYFSFLRPIYDIQIAKIFAKYPKYFNVIRSCNIGQKTDTWCGKCSKCLSTFILFYPFMKDDAVKLFGRNLIEDKELKPIIDSLTLENSVKPFECVGTRHELRVALRIESDPDLLNYWSNENNLPSEFAEVLKNALRK